VEPTRVETPKAEPVRAAAPQQPVVQPSQRQVAAIPARVPAAAPVAAFAPQPQPAGPQLKWTTGPQPAAAYRTAPGRQATAPVQSAKADPETTASTQRSARAGFVIQLGASDDEKKARAILDTARTKNRGVLAEAEAFTEKVQKGDSTLWRARFAGFDDNKEAASACSALKRSGFACFVQRI
jgi:D-alanyl-D-alanine carboxypeptidase